MLIGVSGLPGVGKTHLSRALARHLRGAYVRIDTIEQALVDSGAVAKPVGVAGYAVAYRLASTSRGIASTS